MHICLLTFSRPKENEKVRDELEKAVHIIWNCRLPSPRVSNLVFIMRVSSHLYTNHSYWLFISDSVLLLMLLSRLIWSLLFKCLSSLRWFLPKLGRSCIVKKVIFSWCLVFLFIVGSALLLSNSQISFGCFLGIRTADELSKIMAYFYYGAAKPPCLKIEVDSQEEIPSVPISA